MKKKKRSSDSEVLHKIKLRIIREDQVNQGVYDGRYRTRSVVSSKVYNRRKFKRVSPFKDV
jgi:hypothetical protein